MFKKVMVCLDGSSLAERILPYVTEGALLFNTKVVLMQVLDVPYTKVFIEGADLDTDIVTKECRKEEEEAKDYLESVAMTLRERGLDVEGVVLHRISVDKAILDYAKEHWVDIIAMTTHGRSGLLRTILGSVADSVVRKSGIPVMLINPQDNKT